MGVCLILMAAIMPLFFQKSIYRPRTSPKPPHTPWSFPLAIFFFFFFSFIVVNATITRRSQQQAFTWLPLSFSSTAQRMPFSMTPLDQKWRKGVKNDRAAIWDKQFWNGGGDHALNKMECQVRFFFFLTVIKYVVAKIIQLASTHLHNRKPTDTSVKRKGGWKMENLDELSGGKDNGLLSSHFYSYYYSYYYDYYCKPHFSK